MTTTKTAVQLLALLTDEQRNVLVDATESWKHQDIWVLLASTVGVDSVNNDSLFPQLDLSRNAQADWELVWSVIRSLADKEEQRSPHYKQLFLLMKKHPDSDWRTLLHHYIIQSPSFIDYEAIELDKWAGITDVQIQELIESTVSEVNADPSKLTFHKQYKISIPKETQAPDDAPVAASSDMSIPETKPEPKAKKARHAPDVITVSEIAQRLDRSPGTIREYLQAGRIPGAVNTGGRWAVNREVFEQWIKGDSTNTPTPPVILRRAPAPKPKWKDGGFTPSF